MSFYREEDIKEFDYGLGGGNNDYDAGRERGCDDDMRS